MAKIEGRQLVCDRCGKREFFKLIGTTMRDGGFSADRKYEEAGAWEWVSPFGDLCPACVAEWKITADKFMTIGKLAEEK